MTNIAKTKTSKQLKSLLCDNSLHDIQVFERGKDQIIYSCIYRYAAITLAEDMIPSPDQNGNYIDIDIGDYWWTNDVLIDYFPNPEVASIEEFLAVVQQDEHGCFFG